MTLEGWSRLISEGVVSWMDPAFARPGPRRTTWAVWRKRSGFQGGDMALGIPLAVVGGGGVDGGGVLMVLVRW